MATATGEETFSAIADQHRGFATRAMIRHLEANLREANARLGELRERRAELAPARAAAPTMPSPERIRAYFDDLVSTLESDPAGARDVLASSFSTVRLVPTASAYRLELTMAEVCGKPNCGGRI